MTPAFLAAVAVAVFAAAAAAAVVRLRRTFVVAIVEGDSMAPTYRSGERVLVRRAGLAAVRRGQVVVLEPPVLGRKWSPSPPGRCGAQRQWIIKRAAALPGDPIPAVLAVRLRDPIVPEGLMVVLGDNVAGSVDSREYGYFCADQVLGVVLRRLRRASAPPGPTPPAPWPPCLP